MASRKKLTEEQEKEIMMLRANNEMLEKSKKEALDKIYAEDIDRFLSLFSKEKVMDEIRKNRIYGIRYRLIIDGEPKYVSLKAALLDEPDGPRLIIGVQDIDARLKRDYAYAQKTVIADAKAYTDSLSGVKNKQAYDAAAELLDDKIRKRQPVEFSVSVFGMSDLLNLRKDNTTEEETNLIKRMAEVISGIFRNSAIFRFDKDEFAVISQGQDFEQIDELIRKIEKHNDKNAFVEDLVIPVGMAKYEGDLDVASVYARAIENMKKNDIPGK